MSGDTIRFDSERNLIHLGDRRLVFHCHHYNLFLQQTIADALGPDAAAIQVAAAMEATRALLSGVWASRAGTEDGAGLANRLSLAKQLFMSLGFGNPDVSSLGREGGRVILRTSHYAIGRRSKWGTAAEPVCHFAVGYWMGALSAAANLNPERLQGRELDCAAAHDTQKTEDACVLAIEVL